jgi:hypothetical protein
MKRPAMEISPVSAPLVIKLRNGIVTVRPPLQFKVGVRPRGKVRYCLVSGRNFLGGIFPLVYLLPLRPADPHRPERTLKLPPDLLRTIGPPIPRASFVGGGLPGPARIWQVRTSMRSSRRFFSAAPSPSPG